VLTDADLAALPEQLTTAGIPWNDRDGQLNADGFRIGIDGGQLFARCGKIMIRFDDVVSLLFVLRAMGPRS
jgi:hypothetical protein